MGEDRYWLWSGLSFEAVSHGEVEAVTLPR